MASPRALWLPRFLALSLLLPGFGIAQIDAPRMIGEPGDPEESPSEAPVDQEEAPIEDVPEVASQPPNVIPASATPSAPPPLEDQAPSVPAKAFDRPRSNGLAPARLSAAEALPSPIDSSRRPAKALLAPGLSDADLEVAFAAWRIAYQKDDPIEMRARMKKLVALKEDLAISDLDEYAIAVARASEERRLAGDAPSAVVLASAAAELAPELSVSHSQLARAYLAADITEVGRALSASRLAVAALWSDPRFSKAELANLGVASLFALFGTAVVVVVMLVLRSARYFFHDFHHLFPRSAAKWQTVLFALVLVLLPAVFRLGLVALLVAPLAAVVFYLSTRERAVVAALLASLGALPLAAGALVEAVSFVGTPAEDVFALERGGPSAAGAKGRVEQRATRSSAHAVELLALARYQLRRGQIEAAVAGLTQVASSRARDARLLTNLGNAMMAQGKPDVAAEMYENARRADPDLAAPAFNLARLHLRRAAQMTPVAAGEEVGKARVLFAEALAKDPSLSSRGELPDENLLFTRALVSPPLHRSDLMQLARAEGAGKGISSQVAMSLLGRDGPVAFAYPALLAATLFAFGFLGSRLSASRGCAKCGRPVCKRCDRDLPSNGGLCGQCVNVFSKNLVDAPVKVRKQLEVARYQVREGKLSYLFGLLCSGLGHLFAGLPVRGALYAFFFLFLAFNLFFRQGVLRAPYLGLPTSWALIPTGTALLILYLVSLRGLFKRQA